MRTVIATAMVHSNHTLTLQVPVDIPPEKHEVAVVLQEVRPAENKSFMASWPAHNVGLADPNTTFRRADF